MDFKTALSFLQIGDEIRLIGGEEFYTVTKVYWGSRCCIIAEFPEPLSYLIIGNRKRNGKIIH